MKVPVLFTQATGTYSNILEADPWPLERNALNWPGGHPCIAHPPCRSWSRLRKQANPPPGESLLGIWGMCQVKLYGGILEHPAGSRLWRATSTPPPGQSTDPLSFSIQVNLHDFGYQALKPTWLFIHGLRRRDLPPFPLNFHRVKSTVENLAKPARSSTPAAMARWLIETVHRIDRKSFPPSSRQQKTPFLSSQNSESHPTIMPTPSPLPFPADEIRDSALVEITAAALDIQRLLLFFRGHDQSTARIETALLRLLDCETLIKTLGWSSTTISADWPAAENHPDSAA